MFVIGITGPTAAGKSTILRLFAELGVPTISVDDLYRNLTRPGSPLVAAIADQLGSEFVSNDGNLNRPRLAAAVFGDRELLQRLNRITHPPLLRALQETLTSLRASTDSDVVVIEAAVLEEMGALALVDGLVYVDVDEGTGLSRLMAEGLAEEAAWDRIRAQEAIRRSAEKARWRLDGTWSMERLREVCRQIIAEIRGTGNWERGTGEDK